MHPDGTGEPSTSAALVGRREDLGSLRELLHRAADRGAALLLHGEPGVGKSALLDAAAAEGAALGALVLRAAGVEHEADLGMDAVNRVVLPLVAEVDALPPEHRDALTVVLGLAEGPPPPPPVVAGAVMALLGRVAAQRPVLVVVDDVQWLDRASSGVLAAAARQVQGTRVGLLAARRDGAAAASEWDGVPGRPVRPLPDESAARLVDLRFPSLAAAVRARLLVEARGNPLALLELPAAWDEAERTARRELPAVLPLSRRLRSAFTARVGAVPAATRRLLLLAALEHTADRTMLGRAGGAPGSAEQLLRPACRAGLVELDPATGRVLFRHPLVRSAVVELATGAERRRAHGALAAVLDDDPHRRAWHLADAAPGPDEHVARALDEVARRVRRRGDPAGAVAALVRAAHLSPRGEDRARRLAEAAYVGADTGGRLRDVVALLAEARRVAPGLTGSLAVALPVAYQLLNGDGDVEGALRVLLAAFTRLEDVDPDDVLLAESLHRLVVVSYFGARPEGWAAVRGLLARLPARALPLPRLYAEMVEDPTTAAPETRDRLDAVVAGLSAETDQAAVVRIGFVCFSVDRGSEIREALRRVARDGRAGTAVSSGMLAMVMLSFDQFLTGEWDEAQLLADELLALSVVHGYPLFTCVQGYSRAQLAAARGDAATVRAATTSMIDFAAPGGVRTVTMFAEHARTLAALGRGEFEQAHRHARAVAPIGRLDLRTAPVLRATMDLVEAAVRTGRRAEAAAHVAAVRDAGVAALSPRLALVVAGSAAMAADRDRAGELFERAVSLPGAERWPFDLARIRLAHGEHLRRNRATTAARVQLAAAEAAFRRLGARPWLDRTVAELAATGRGAPGSGPPGAGVGTARHGNGSPRSSSGSPPRRRRG